MMIPYLVDLINSKRGTYREMMENYFFLKKAINGTREEIEAYQHARLKELVKYALDNVPFYSVYRDKLDFNEDITVEIKKLPVLTKKILRERFADLKSTSFSGWQKENTSGGSTGEPAIFLQDSQYCDQSDAYEKLFFERIGRKGFERLIKLWGSEKDFLQEGVGLAAFKEKVLYNRFLLNAFKMNETDMAQYCNEIRRLKPVVIEAYAQSMYELAKYANATGQSFGPIRSIVTSAGTLTDEMRETIKKVFKTSVYNRYGSREVGGVAHSCQLEDRLHINCFNHFVEVLDDVYHPTPAGEIGNAYITVLDNYVMPLIRYEIGDRIELMQSDKCSCGNNMPIIKSVVGRMGSMIVTASGRMDSTALTTSFYFYRSVVKYQLIQKKIDLIELLVVVDSKEQWEKDSLMILEKFSKLLGPEMQIEVKVVDYIEPSKSGKHMYFVSELN